MKYFAFAFAFAFAFSLVSVFFVSCKTAEPASPTATAPSPDEIFAYQKNENWNYTGEKSGPDKWGLGNQKWRKCHMGKQQSPIDIVHAAKHELPPLQYHYAPMPLRIRRDHGFLKIYSNGNQFVKYRDKQYRLQYLEIHVPSEHKILSHSAPIEIQFYHQSENSDDWLAISVLLKEGGENSELSWIGTNIPAEGKKNNPDGVAIDPSLLIPHAQTKEAPDYNDDFYQYNGSLTKPPCTENVTWFVMANYLEASKDQIEMFVNAIPHSARPTISDSNRTVYQSHGTVDLIAKHAIELRKKAEEEQTEDSDEETSEETIQPE